MFKPFKCRRCQNHLGATNGVVLLWQGRTWERKTRVICHHCYEARVWYPAAQEAEEEQPLWDALDGAK